jgi:PAS domain S-box-containing protein
MIINKVLYSSLMQHMNEAVSITDKNGITIYVNPQFCKLIWMSEAEIIWKPGISFVDAASKKKVREMEKTERSQWNSSTYEINFISKSWEIIPVILKGTPLSWGDTIGIITDMREYKKQLSVHTRLIENMAEAVWMGDEHEKTIYANPRFCKLVWYELEEILWKESYIFWDEKSANTVRSTNTSKRKKWESSSYYGNLLTKQGEIIPVHLNGTSIEWGWTIGIMTDLRELKAKEESEKILYNAVQYSTDAIIMCDKDGNINSWNKWAQLIFGYKESIIWKNISLLFEKKDIACILQSDVVVNKYEVSAKHKNRQKMRASVTQAYIYNQSRTKIISYLLICRDITNHRKIEDEIESKYKKIREVYESIGIIKRQTDYIFELLDMFETYYFDQKTLWDFIVTSIIMLTRADGCELRLYDTKEDKLEMVSHFGFSQDWSGKKKIYFKWSLAEKAFKNGKPLKIIDIFEEPKYQTPALARKHGMTSLLLIPLKVRWECIGMLSLYTKADKKLEIFENEFIEKYAKVIQLILAW